MSKKIRKEYNPAKENERKMSARIFQERKMSAGFLVSANESAAHVIKNERYRERRS